MEVIIDPATDMEEDIQRLRPGNPQWVKGMESPNPGGRPKNTLKEYDRQRFINMSDEEKEAFLSLIDPAMRYRMAEGNPTEDKNIKVSVPTPILGGQTQQIQGEIVQEVLLDGENKAQN